MGDIILTKEIKPERVTCVFGALKQEQAKLIDPLWCEEHCEARDAYERHHRSYDCFWHFNNLGIDMRK